MTSQPRYVSLSLASRAAIAIIAVAGAGTSVGGNLMLAGHYGTQVAKAHTPVYAQVARAPACTRAS